MRRTRSRWSRDQRDRYTGDLKQREQRRISRRERRRRAGQVTHCPLCHGQRSFFWTCPCGFVMCDVCMQRERWGMTCNNMTWVCPDCGQVRSY